MKATKQKKAKADNKRNDKAWRELRDLAIRLYEDGTIQLEDLISEGEKLFTIHLKRR